MPYAAKVIEILIASPGDVKEERRAAREIVLDWNRIYTRRLKLVLLPRMWELDATPQFGLDPQAAVNEQLVDSSDLLVAILWTRLGSPTPRSPSGTVEEITKFVDAKKPGMLYFSSRQTDPHTIDFSQLQAVKDFRSAIRNRALCGQFSDLEDFKKQFSDHLNNTVDKYFARAEIDEEASTLASPTRYRGADDVARQKFAESQHVFVATTIEESWSNSDQKTIKHYVVRMPRKFLESNGIEWDYDFMLGDQNFVSLLVDKITSINSESLLSGGQLWGKSYSVLKCEFYRGDRSSLPESYHQVGDNCSVWEISS